MLSDLVDWILGVIVQQIHDEKMDGDLPIAVRCGQTHIVIDSDGSCGWPSRNSGPSKAWPYHR